MIDIPKTKNCSARDNDEEKQQNSRTSGSREAKILSVEMSPAHRMSKEMWRADLRIFETQKEDAMDELRRLREELLQIVSMSLIFEGVVFTGVAQSNKLTCSMAWSPIGLALSVAAAACATVVVKYRAIYETEIFRESADGNIKAIMVSLELLDREGSALDLRKAQPVSSYDWPKARLRRTRILFVAKRAILTIALLVILSLIVSFFSKITLCRDCKPCPAPQCPPPHGYPSLPIGT